MKARHFLIAVIALLLPLAAVAQEARTAKASNLRAGPARDYPLVATFGPGTPLAVQGCTEGYGWCDVIGPGEVRGWIYAGNIVYPYQSTEVPILEYGPTLGFPIIGFSLGTYWGEHYRNRPWFGNRDRWAHHRPPPRPIMRPPMPHLPGGRPPFVHSPGGRPPEGRPPGERPGEGEHRGGGRPSGGEHHGGGEHPGGGEHHGGGEHPGGGEHHGGSEHPGGGEPHGGGEHPGGGEHHGGGEHPR